MKKVVCYMMCAILLLCCFLSAGCSASKGEKGLDLCYQYLDYLQAGDYTAAYDLLTKESKAASDTHDGYSITYERFAGVYPTFIEKHSILTGKYQVTSTACSDEHARVGYDQIFTSKDDKSIALHSAVDAHYDPETRRWGIVWKQDMDPNEEYRSQLTDEGKAACQQYLDALQRLDYASAFALLAEDSVPSGLTYSAFENMFDAFYADKGITACSFEVTDTAYAENVVFAVYDTRCTQDNGHEIQFNGSIRARYHDGQWNVIWDTDLDPATLYGYAYGVVSDAVASVSPDASDIQTGDELMSLLLSRKKPNRADVTMVQLGEYLQLSVPTDWEMIPENALDADLFFQYDGKDTEGTTVSLVAYTYAFQQDFEALQVMANVIDPGNFKATINGAEALVVSDEHTANLFFLTADGTLLAILFGGENIDFHTLSLSTKLVDDMTDIVHSIEFIG